MAGPARSAGSSTAFVAAGVLGIAFSYAQTYFTGWTGERMLADLRNHLFKHLQRLSLGFYERNRAGVIISRLTNDVEALDQLVTDGVTSLVQNSADARRHRSRAVLPRLAAGARDAHRHARRHARDGLVPQALRPRVSGRARDARRGHRHARRGHRRHARAAVVHARGGRPGELPAGQRHVPRSPTCRRSSSPASTSRSSTSSRRRRRRSCSATAAGSSGTGTSRSGRSSRSSAT